MAKSSVWDTCPRWTAAGYAACVCENKKCMVAEEDYQGRARRLDIECEKPPRHASCQVDEGLGLLYCDGPSRYIPS